jgi:hypothetical protein
VREAFLLDSGAASHLIKRSSLIKIEIKRIRISAMPMTLETVNGSRDATEEVEVWIPVLSSLLTFYVVNGRTPNLISLERLCDEEKFHYNNEPNRPSFLWRQSDNPRIQCKTLCNVPIIAAAVANESIIDKPGDGEVEAEAKAFAEDDTKSN